MSAAVASAAGAAGTQTGAGAGAGGEVRAPEAPALLRAVVAGYGNPLRGDDGAGWEVVSLIEGWLAALPAATRGRYCVLCGQHPVPEWAPMLAEAETAVFVDASPGVHHATARRIAAGGPGGALMDGHAAGPEGVLALAGVSFGRVPEAYLVSVPARDFSFAERLSPQTEAGVRDAAALVRLLVDGQPMTAAPVIQAPEAGAVPCA